MDKSTSINESFSPSKKKQNAESLLNLEKIIILTFVLLLAILITMAVFFVSMIKSSRENIDSYKNRNITSIAKLTLAQHSMTKLKALQDSILEKEITDFNRAKVTAEFIIEQTSEEVETVSYIFTTPEALSLFGNWKKTFDSYSKKLLKFIEFTKNNKNLNLGRKDQIVLDLESSAESTTVTIANLLVHEITTTDEEENTLKTKQNVVSWILLFSLAFASIVIILTVKFIFRRFKIHSDELEARKERLELALDAGKMAAWDIEISQSSEIGKLNWTDSLTKVMGIPPETRELKSLTLQDFTQLLRLDDRALFLTFIEDLKKELPHLGIESRLIERNDKNQVIFSTGKLYQTLRTKDKYHIIGITLDITDRKNQDELIQNQQIKLLETTKLSSLGEMAAQIGHEINNPLAVIYGKVDIITKALKKTPLEAEVIAIDVAKIKLVAERIAKIVKSIKSFSRNSEQDPFSPTNLKSIIDDSLEIFRFKNQGQNTPLKLSIPDLLPTIDCRSTEISQAILILLNNAYDVVQSFEEKWIELKTQQNQDHITISVIDSGRGIPPEILKKLMTPFFTTKPVGAGTGLGLSIAKSIIEAHGGRFFYDSTNKNTCFKIELPYQTSP